MLTYWWQGNTQASWQCNVWKAGDGWYFVIEINQLTHEEILRCGKQRVRGHIRH